MQVVKLLLQISHARFLYSIMTKKANTMSVFVGLSDVFVTGAGTDLSRRMISVSSLKYSAYQA